jgi:hypothetical protein
MYACMLDPLLRPPIHKKFITKKKILHRNRRIHNSAYSHVCVWGFELLKQNASFMYTRFERLKEEKSHSLHECS